MNRIPTHVPNLDEVLYGGIPENSVILLSGVPGSGKTILAQQIAFGVAASGGKALIVSTLSEPLARMVRFMQAFTFFDVDAIGTSVIYEDVGTLLLQESGERAIEEIVSLLRQESPTLLVIDSFKAIQEMSFDKERLRRALYTLMGTVAAYPCTALLIGEYTDDDMAKSVVTSMVDGIISLYNQRIGLHDRRYLRVSKLRGSAYIPGEHAFRITEQGITVFPRIVPPRAPLPYTPGQERVGLGIPGLDEMLHGGLMRGAVALVAGDPGVGKTVTAIHFLLNGARQGERGVYFTFQEDPYQWRQIARNFGFDVGDLERRGMVQVVYSSPVEIDVEQHAWLMRETVSRVGAQRVVVDSMRDLEVGARGDPERFFNYAYGLMQWLKERQVTTLITSEIGEIFGTDLILSGVGLSHIADVLIVLRYTVDRSRIRRAIAVLAQRGSPHSDEVREYLISEKKGPRVGAPLSGGFTLWMQGTTT